tara:strand:+ start:282 stop:551 length:270 start_codon:yes stop_codon:yes gene_type:complete
MSKERVKQYRLRQKELGRLKREFYLTESELAKTKAFINNLRNGVTGDEVARLKSELESMAAFTEFFGEQNEKLVIENAELKRKLKGKLN